MAHDGFVYKELLQENEDFMELMLRTPATKRNVMVFDFNKFTPKSFHLKLTPIDRKGTKAQCCQSGFFHSSATQCTRSFFTLP